MANKLLSGKRLDMVVVIGLTGLGFLYAYLTRNSALGSALCVCIFYTITIVPYLGLREKKNWKKILLASAIFGVVFGFILDFICEYTLAYSVVARVFKPKLLGVLPFDNLIGHAGMVLLTTVFYEHFVDDEKQKEISSNLLFSILPAAFAIVILLAIYFVRPTLLNVRYPYFYLGLAAIVLPVLLAIKKPSMIRKMVITAGYFFVLYFVMEIFAVSYDWWIYTGDNYIGWITIFGKTFPFEEFFFWMMFYAATVVSYYEVFIDDLR